MKHLLSILVILLSSTLMAHAQETQTITVGPDTVSYTDVYEDVDRATSYYADETLVLTVYDEDGNGKPDVWVMYREDYSVKKEMRDGDDDGQPDIFFEFDADENLVSSTGEGLQKYEPEIPVVEDEPTSQEEVDYAGDLEDIEKLAGEGGGFLMWVIILLALAAGFFFWKKKS